jgi:protein-tyrosine-phosphatase
MEIRNRSTGAVTTVSQFKAEYPNTSFPKQITTEVLNSFGYDAVLNGAAATVTSPYGVSIRSGVEEIDGQWFTKFVAGPVFADTTDDDGNVTTAADNEVAYKARIDAEAAKSVRTQRDRLIAETDWVVVMAKETGTNIPAAMKTYRQALRDLPSAEGFPHTMTWPTKPS